MSIDPESARIAVQTVRDAAARLESLSLPDIDVGEESATATLGRLSAALNSFPDVYVAQTAIAAAAIALTVSDAVTADTRAV